MTENQIIAQVCAKYEIYPNTLFDGKRTGVFTKARRECILELWNAMVPVATIAKLLHTSKWTVYNTLYLLGAETPSERWEKEMGKE